MARTFPVPDFPSALPLERVRVQPLAERKSLTSIDQILVAPESTAAALSPERQSIVEDCARHIIYARERGAAVMLVYGAHLLRNGAALILERMMASGWITHLATNGAGTIHDWEYSWFGRSTESVEENVATGSFGAWDETGRNIHLALYAGSIRGEGYGRSLGRYIYEGGADFPEPPSEPGLLGAAADYRAARQKGLLPSGRHCIDHRWKHASILAQAFRHNLPLTVHPGIGYDIIANHPMFNGALIGRAADLDFRLFGGSVEQLDHGVVLSIGSAIMGPQVFEKSLSCVNNLRLQQNRPVVSGHSIYVVDLQDGGNWDWTKGEPPKANPAYYLRFCKSFSRMGGRMQYLQCDNLAFVHQLFRELSRA